ncbi:unnamed protein product [Lupinus luteus]|uniref:Uncharacterized protein n=1 Tax=Lupinus luteus TaxID=3873 RepID=A0AAV1Y0C3_LUPLU
MAFTQPNHFKFPKHPSPPSPSGSFYLPPPPSFGQLHPPSSHPFSTLPSSPFHPIVPPPHVFPPQPRTIMAFTHSFYPPPPPSFGPPHPPPSHPFSAPPPSPFHPIVPPPHVFPPPAPVPVSPSPFPNNHPIVIVVVFVSLGGLVLLSLLAFVLCCSIKKSKKKKTRETNIIHVDEHKEIKETIATGPSGRQAVVLSVEDDVKIEEEITKNEEKVGHSLHAEFHQGNSKSKKKNRSQEMDIIHVDEHKKIKETIVADPLGQKEVVLSIEDDLHIEGEKTKNDEKFGQNLHATEDQGNSSSNVVGTTSSDHEHQKIENKL